MQTTAELTGRQREIWSFLVDYVDRHGYPPTVREIGEEVGLASPSTVHAHLANLERAGLLRRDPTKPRALELIGRERQQALPRESEERADVARLTAIPGVGRKTSERLVVELKDRLPRLAVADAAVDVEAPPSAVRDDVLSALVNLGYHRPLAEKAVAAAVKSVPDGAFERTLKQALRELAK